MEEISNTYSLTEAKVAKMERDPGQPPLTKVSGL